MKKIGIFGGTFNPIHTGHLKIARRVLTKLNLNEVIFVPSYLPPHKIKYDLASAYDRYKMIKIATDVNSKFNVSNTEIKRKGKSYSIDTIREFRKKFGKSAELFFIIGSDTLSELKDWKKITQINKLVKFAVVERPGYPVKRNDWNSKVVDSPRINISSSLIRMKLDNNCSIRHLVPNKVNQYIALKGLYSSIPKGKVK